MLFFGIFFSLHGSVFNQKAKKVLSILCRTKKKKKKRMESNKSAKKKKKLVKFFRKSKMAIEKGMKNLRVAKDRK